MMSVVSNDPKCKLARKCGQQKVSDGDNDYEEISK